jgi:hypothetical protein
MMAARALTLDREIFWTEEQVRAWLAWARRSGFAERLGPLCVPGEVAFVVSKGDWLLRPQAELASGKAIDRRTMPDMKPAKLAGGVALYED